MADYIKVNAPDMSKDLNDMRDIQEKIPKMVEMLETSMSILQNMWQGEAWEAFQLQMRNDITYLQNVYQFQEEYLNAFTEAKYTYQDTEILIRDEVLEIKFF